jgi:hypothetical protein
MQPQVYKILKHLTVSIYIKIKNNKYLYIFITYIKIKKVAIKIYYHFLQISYRYV